MLAELLSHRGYIWRNAVLELRHRYAGSRLGPLWLLAFPLAQILIYSLVFSKIMQAKVPELAHLPISFTLYLCSGLLPWIGFAEIVSRSTSSLIDNAGLIGRTALPEQVFPGQVALTGLIAMGINMLLLLLVASVLGLRPMLGWLAVPGVLVLLAAFAFGIGTLLAVLNVFARDYSTLVGLLLQLLMWTAPIVYVESILPATLQSLLVLNPIYSFVAAMHESVLFGQVPSALRWLAMLAIASASCALGLTLLGRLRVQVRDVL